MTELDHVDYRLPTTVVPSRYDLRLEPDLDKATFSGEETVTVEVREPVTEIVLNAAELRIESAVMEDASGALVEGSVALDEPAERARILFPAPIAPGPWRLRLRFTGILNDRLHGFYRSSYKDAAGVAHTIAATQFEATDARRAFPCWDEPAAKAVFGVTLVVPEGLAAISNTAVVSESPAGPGRRAVTFADSIRMSTYLVAFVVGELEATPPVMVGKTPLRIWCVPGKTHLARVAQQIGAFSLEFFEQYYGLPYPGDKLDLLAIPDFAAGAMENLGAVTFRETALLVDEAAASHTEIERVADVVAHEVAHMWFGDLVTMLWWNGIWLNEAFATFMELLAVDAWKPEWKRWVTFGVSRAAAMGVDGLVNTRPIEFEVKAPKDCEAMFDLLTYEKGASVLRMLEQHIGPDVFRDGVRLYLERHQFGNAETTDLWKALGDASRQPIPEVMDGWIFHPGYPLVRVEADGQGLRLSQRRFTYLGEDAAGRWRIPIVLRAWVKRGIIEKHVLLDGDDLLVPLPAAPEWAIVNAGGHGFYRVGYARAPPEEALGRLAAAVAHRALQPRERQLRARPIRRDERRRVPRALRALHRGDGPERVGGDHRLLRVPESRDRRPSSGPDSRPSSATGSPRRWSASAGRPSPRRASSCASSAEISCGRWACWAMIPSRRSAPESSTRGSARAAGRWMRTCCPRSSPSWRRAGARRSTRSSGSASALRAPPRRSSGISSPWPAFATPISCGGRSATRSTARCGARTRRSSCARCSAASMGASWPGSSSRSTGRRWRACTRAARIGACTRASPRS